MIEIQVHNCVYTNRSTIHKQPVSCQFPLYTLTHICRNARHRKDRLFYDANCSLQNPEFRLKKYFVRMGGKDCYCGLAGKTATCKARISHGYWFLSQILNFCSSSLVMAWKRQWKWSKCLGTHHPIQVRLLASTWLTRLFGVWTNKQKIPFCDTISFSTT